MKNKLLPLTALIIGSAVLVCAIAPNAKAVSFKKHTNFRPFEHPTHKDNGLHLGQGHKHPGLHLGQRKKDLPYISKKQTPEQVPEPLTILGTMAAGGFGYVMKRKNKTAD